MTVNTEAAGLAVAPPPIRVENCPGRGDVTGTVLEWAHEIFARTGRPVDELIPLLELLAGREFGDLDELLAALPSAEEFLARDAMLSLPRFAEWTGGGADLAVRTNAYLKKLSETLWKAYRDSAFGKQAGADESAEPDAKPIPEGEDATPPRLASDLLPVHLRIRQLLRIAQAQCADVTELLNLSRGQAADGDNNNAPAPPVVHPYFADAISDNLDAVHGLLGYFSRADLAGPAFHLMSGPDFARHLLARRNRWIYFIGDTPGAPRDLTGPPLDKPVSWADDDDNDNAGAHPALGLAPEQPPPGLSYARGVKATSYSRLKNVPHRGLPILSINLADLPPAMIATILEVRSRCGVHGAVYAGVRRKTEPNAPGALRSIHQNELGMLPALPADTVWDTKRALAYHLLFADEAEQNEGLSGAQQAKGIAVEETGIYEINAAGVSDANIRLLYDYAHDRFFITFHYQLIGMSPKPDGSYDVVTASKEQAIPILKDKDHVQDGKIWTSGVFLIETGAAPGVTVPAEQPQAPQPVRRKGKQKEAAPLVRPFPGLPLDGPPKQVIPLEVPLATWKSAMADLNLKQGTTGGTLMVYDIVNKSFFDFHLTCIRDVTGESVKQVHFAVRLKGVHTWVIYWWYDLLWTNAPQGVFTKPPAQGATFPGPKFGWYFPGPISGHGARVIEEFWSILEPYGPLLDARPILDTLAKALATATDTVTVKKKNAATSKPETFFHLT